MRATEATKREAYEAGYAFVVAHGYLASRTARCPYHIPAEAWAWVRGAEQARVDGHAKPDQLT
jgi:hypothetical protein